VAFGVFVPRSVGGGGHRAAPLYSGEPKMRCFAVAVCFSHLPFFSHGYPKKKKCEVGISVIGDSTR